MSGLARHRVDVGRLVIVGDGADIDLGAEREEDEDRRERRVGVLRGEHVVDGLGLDAEGLGHLLGRDAGELHRVCDELRHALSVGRRRFGWVDLAGAPEFSFDAPQNGRRPDGVVADGCDGRDDDRGSLLLAWCHVAILSVPA